MGLSAENDGIFWMKYDDFIKYYEGTSTALYIDDMQLKTAKLSAGKGTYNYRIDNPVE